MDKKLKRESKQTGMTDERRRALDSIRELKKSGKSRLEQAIEVRKNFFIFIFFYRMEKLIIR